MVCTSVQCFLDFLFTWLRCVHKNGFGSCRLHPGYTYSRVFLGATTAFYVKFVKLIFYRELFNQSVILYDKRLLWRKKYYLIFLKFYSFLMNIWECILIRPTRPIDYKT